MGRFEKELTRVSAWRGPTYTVLSHFTYRDKPGKVSLIEEDAILLLNHILFQQTEPPKQVRITVEWE
jgi:hypothetical protein